MRAYLELSRVLALAMVVLGAVIAVETIVHGGGIGIVLGLLFVAAGVGRLYLLRGR